MAKGNAQKKLNGDNCCLGGHLGDDIRHRGNVNSCFDDPHDATGRFPFSTTGSACANILQ